MTATLTADQIDFDFMIEDDETAAALYEEAYAEIEDVRRTFW